MPPDPLGFPALQQEAREKLPEKLTPAKVLYVVGGLLLMGAGGLGIAAGAIMLTAHRMDLAFFVATFLGSVAMYAGYELYRRSQWRHWQPHRGSNLETLERFQPPAPSGPANAIEPAE